VYKLQGHLLIAIILKWDVVAGLYWQARHTVPLQ